MEEQTQGKGRVMRFRTRLLALCGVLAGLLALLLLGISLSPERVQSRTSGRPLLPGARAQKIDAIDISVNGETKVALRRTASGWETPSGARTYPASSDRINTFLRTVTGLPRTSLVSSDTRHLPELGLSTDAARLLVLHQTGAPDAALLVGKRGPTGDADYVQVRGQEQVYLARGSLAFFLAQDHSYWYELHVLPDDVQGATIAAISVRGSLRLDGTGASVIRGGYTLKRPSAEKQDQWVVGSPEKPADRVTAGAMANSLAMLEGLDFAEGPAGAALPGAASPPGGASPGGASPGGAERLEISVETFAGRKYSISASLGPEPGKVRITTSWSPWTYILNALLLQRAVLPESSLAAAR
jgi:hypothetical protein